MINPYRSPNSSPSFVKKHAVRRFYYAAFVFGSIGLLVGAPGCFLLNQEWQFIPVSITVGGFDVNGRATSASTLIWFFLLTGAAILLASAWVASFGLRNSRKNRVLMRAAPENRG